MSREMIAGSTWNMAVGSGMLVFQPVLETVMCQLPGVSVHIYAFRVCVCATWEVLKSVLRLAGVCCSIETLLTKATKALPRRACNKRKKELPTGNTHYSLH